MRAVKTMYLIMGLTCISGILAYGTDSFAMNVLSAIFFGICDSGAQTVLGSLLAMKFTETYGPYACFRFLFSVFVAFFFLVDIVFKDHIIVVLIMMLLIVLYGSVKFQRIFSFR